MIEPHTATKIHDHVGTDISSAGDLGPSKVTAPMMNIDTKVNTNMQQMQWLIGFLPVTIIISSSLAVRRGALDSRGKTFKTTLLVMYCLFVPVSSC